MILTQTNVSNFRNNMSDYFDTVSKKKSHVIITNRGIPSYVVFDIDEYEDFLSSKNKNLLNKIKESRKEIKDGKFKTAEEVFSELGI